MVSAIKDIVRRLIAYFLPHPDPAPAGEATVTEKGVKAIINRLFTFLTVGVSIGSILNGLRHAGTLQPLSEILGGTYASNPFAGLSFIEYILFTLGLMYYIAMPFLRFMHKWLKVTGVIYAVAVGFILSCGSGVAELHIIIIVAVSIACTAVLSLLPLYLLRKKNMMLPKNFAKITQITFLVVTLGNSVLRILDQIPFIRLLTGHIIEFTNFISVRIAVDGLKVVLAFFFMFIAYDRMRDYSTRGVPKKYEWLAAFTGFYTVGVIIVKISEMLTLITG